MKTMRTCLVLCGIIASLGAVALSRAADSQAPPQPAVGPPSAGPSNLAGPPGGGGPPAGGGPPGIDDGQVFPPPTDPHVLEGAWKDVPQPGSTPFMIGLDLPYKPETRALVSRRLELMKKGTPVASAHLTCRPTGVAGALFPMFSVVVLQTPNKLIFLSEEDRDVRTVFLSRPHPKSLTPTYGGDSVAHWEGDTLVVDTVGYNRLGWIDEWGTPHSDKLHMIQRFTKADGGKTLTIATTFDDPVYFTKPFTVTKRWQWNSGARQLENDCAENPRSDAAEGMIFENELFRPVCVQSSDNGKLSSTVTCSKPPKVKP
jgi:hypothetical protein